MLQQLLSTTTLSFNMARKPFGDLREEQAAIAAKTMSPLRRRALSYTPSWAASISMVQTASSRLQVRLMIMALLVLMLLPALLPTLLTILPHAIAAAVEYLPCLSWLQRCNHCQSLDMLRAGGAYYVLRRLVAASISNGSAGPPPLNPDPVKLPGAAIRPWLLWVLFHLFRFIAFPLTLSLWIITLLPPILLCLAIALTLTIFGCFVTVFALLLRFFSPIRTSPIFIRCGNRDVLLSLLLPLIPRRILLLIFLPRFDGVLVLILPLFDWVI